MHLSSKHTENFAFSEEFVNTFKNHERFEFFTVVTLKNVVFWDVTPCG
jgi:hypothetical protein